MAHDRKGAPQRPSRLATMRVVIALIFINATVYVYAQQLHDSRRRLLTGGVLLVSMVCLAARGLAHRSARTKGQRP